MVRYGDLGDGRKGGLILDQGQEEVEQSAGRYLVYTYKMAMQEKWHSLDANGQVRISMSNSQALDALLQMVWRKLVFRMFPNFGDRSLSLEGTEYLIESRTPWKNMSSSLAILVGECNPLYLNRWGIPETWLFWPESDYVNLAWIYSIARAGFNLGDGC